MYNESIYVFLKDKFSKLIRLINATKSKSIFSILFKTLISRGCIINDIVGDTLHAGEDVAYSKISSYIFMDNVISYILYRSLVE